MSPILNEFSLNFFCGSKHGVKAMTSFEVSFSLGSCHCCSTNTDEFMFFIYHLNVNIDEEPTKAVEEKNTPATRSITK